MSTNKDNQQDQRGRSSIPIRSHSREAGNPHTASRNTSVGSNTTSRSQTPSARQIGVSRSQETADRNSRSRSRPENRNVAAVAGTRSSESVERSQSRSRLGTVDTNRDSPERDQVAGIYNIAPSADPANTNVDTVPDTPAKAQLESIPRQMTLDENFENLPAEMRTEILAQLSVRRILNQRNHSEERRALIDRNANTIWRKIAEMERERLKKFMSQHDYSELSLLVALGRWTQHKGCWRGPEMRDQADTFADYFVQSKRSESLTESVRAELGDYIETLMTMHCSRHPDPRLEPLAMDMGLGDLNLSERRVMESCEERHSRSPSQLYSM